ncbi:MAG: hypothetical protein F6K47_19785 [Symploca sp. SIO2E6]|nr:hypothetical protein [Symploca sp. SIO2E6]
MSTAVLSIFGFKIEDLQQIQSRTIKPSRFKILEKAIRLAANRIKQNWNGFSPEEKTALREVAYNLLEPSAGVDNLYLWLKVGFYVLLIKLTKQEKDFYLCLDAIDCLVDNILDAVERDDSSYQQVLSDTLEELKKYPESGEPIDANRREWLQKLSDKALSEV